MKTNQQLINNIIGQLNGLQKMLDSEEECFRVLTQMKAAKSALNSLMKKYLEKEFTSCLRQCTNKEEQDLTCQKFFKEITTLS